MSCSPPPHTPASPCLPRSPPPLHAPEVFVPAVKSSDHRKEASEVAHAVHDAPLIQLLEVVNMLLFGW
jgi:hypothetical protein